LQNFRTELAYNGSVQSYYFQLNSATETKSQTTIDKSI